MVAYGGKCGINCSSLYCGSSCYPSKLKADSEQLYGVSATSSMVSSTVGGGGRI